MMPFKRPSKPRLKKPRVPTGIKKPRVPRLPGSKKPTRGKK